MKLAGWTLARTLLIAPPMMIVGVPWKQALLGALFASGLISTLAVVRLYNAKTTGTVGGSRVPTTIITRSRRSRGLHV